MRFIIIFLSIIFFITGCESAVNRISKYDEYKKTKTHDECLVLPKDLNKEVIEDRYPIPKVKKKKEAPIHSSTIPPGSKITK